MKESLLKRILALKNASLAELRQKYAELHEGKTIRINNKTYLWRRIAYRIQEIEYGGLSEKVQSKLNEMIQEYDPINNKTFRPEISPNRGSQAGKTRDRRLPIPGTTITKNYKGVRIEVKILDKGFEYRGKRFDTLSAIAKEITGSHWNGYSFFGI